MDLIGMWAGLAMAVIGGVCGRWPGRPLRARASPILLRYPRLPAHRLVCSGVVHAVPTTLPAAGPASFGLVDWKLPASLLVGSLPGLWMGARFTRALPEKLVRARPCASLVPPV